MLREILPFDSFDATDGRSVTPEETSEPVDDIADRVRTALDTFEDGNIAKHLQHEWSMEDDI